MADGKRITKATLLADLQQIQADLDAQPQHRLLFKSDLLQARAAVARCEAQLLELRAREFSLKAAQATCEKMLAAIDRKAQPQPRPEKSRGSPVPWSPPDADDIPAVGPTPEPPALRAEPPKELPKPAPLKAVPLVHVGDECKSWTPADWATYYRTGKKPEPKPEPEPAPEAGQPKEPTIAEETGKTILDAEAVR